MWQDIYLKNHDFP